MERVHQPALVCFTIGHGILTLETECATIVAHCLKLLYTFKFYKIPISIAAIECPRLTAPTNGFVDYTPSSDTFPFDYLTTGTFRCRFRYRLAGGDTVRTCVGSSSGPGEWTGTDPICEGWYNYIFWSADYNI